MSATDRLRAEQRARGEAERDAKRKKMEEALDDELARMAQRWDYDRY